MKELYFLVLLLCGLAQADYVSLADHSIYIGLDSSQYAVVPYALQVSDASATAQTIVCLNPYDNFGLLGWVEYFEPADIRAIQPIAETSFESIAARIVAEEDNGSVVLTGLAKQGGRKCYYKAVPLDLANGTFTKLVYFVAAYNDPALNEKLVKEFDAQDLIS